MDPSESGSLTNNNNNNNNKVSAAYKKSPGDRLQPPPTTSDKTKHSAPSKPAQPLQTSRLRPYRQRHNRSVMSILDDGRVCIELLKEEKVKEVMKKRGVLSLVVVNTEI